MTCITAKRLSFAAAAALALGSLSAPAPAAAQIRALLPIIDQVERLEALPIDGFWEIRETGKRIVIEGGHAYAEEGWVHMLLFRVEPGQVVIKDIRETADGTFVAQDLPLMANVRLEWIDEDTLRAQAGGLIPITYHLEMVSNDGSGFGWDDPDGGLNDDEFGPPPSDDDEDTDSPW